MAEDREDETVAMETDCPLPTEEVRTKDGSESKAINKPVHHELPWYVRWRAFF